MLNTDPVTMESAALSVGDLLGGPAGLGMAVTGILIGMPLWLRGVGGAGRSRVQTG